MVRAFQNIAAVVGQCSQHDHSGQAQSETLLEPGRNKATVFLLGLRK